MKKKNSRESYLSIRQKLIAAVAMLLVATFMVASSSYAWFTLSTAPEVTGVYTAVGANGSLEMALLNKNTAANLNSITATAGNAGNNETWGNLVDLSKSVENQRDYGLEQISLMPARLNVSVTDGNYIVNAAAPLKVAKYVSDGRMPTELDLVMAGRLNDNKTSFIVDGNAKGVVALGTATGMTAQQLAWTNYKSAVNTNVGLAQTKADAVLEANGTKIGTVIMKRALESATTGFDISFVPQMVTDLAAANADILASVKAYFGAKAAEALYNSSDAEWATAKAAIDAVDFTNYTGTETSVTVEGTAVPLDSIIKNALTKYNDIKTKLAAVTTAYGTGTYTDSTTSDSASWEYVHAVMFASNFLVYDNIRVNGKTAAEIRTLMTKVPVKDSEGNETGEMTFSEEAVAFGMAFVQDGLIAFETGSGVFADIADISGAYQAEISVSVNFSGLNYKNDKVKLRAVTTSRIDMYSLLANQPADKTSSSTDTKNLTDFYGYRLDFAFRTNASTSNLMLQTDAAGRIYSSGGSEDTQGHGSTMTFGIPGTDYTVAQAKNLMKTIRIVFTDANGQIVAVGALCQDTASTTDYTISANNEITSKIYLYEYSFDGDGIMTLGAKKNADANGKTELVALDQNVAKAVSVYVYIDGDLVDNTMVSATSELSVSGALNLQFSSSAELIPMDYAPLKNQNTTENSGETTETQAPTNP